MLALNNGMQLVVLQHQSQASHLLIFWEIIYKKSTSPSIFFVFEIGSEEGSQYGDIANSLVVKVYLSCSDTVDSR